MMKIPTILLLLIFCVSFVSISASNNEEERPAKILRANNEEERPAKILRTDTDSELITSGESWCGLCGSVMPEPCSTYVASVPIHDKCFMNLILDSSANPIKVLHEKIGTEIFEDFNPHFKISKKLMSDIVLLAFYKENVGVFARLIEMRIPIQSISINDHRLKNAPNISLLEAAAIYSPNVFFFLAESGIIFPRPSFKVLAMAVEKGHVQVVEYLIDKCGYSANQTCCSTCSLSLLHIAIKKDKIEMVKSLLRLGARTDIFNAKEGYPLQQAVALNRPEIVEALLQAGADVDIRSKGKTPVLMSAANSGKIDLVRIILQYPSKDSFRYFADDKLNVLHAAIISGNIDLVKLLLQRGFNCLMEDRTPSTLLHYMICCSNDLKMVEFLLDNFSDPSEPNIKHVFDHIIKQFPDFKGLLTLKDPPAVTAIICDRKEVLEMLLSRGFNPNIQIFNGTSTLLHLARRKRNSKIIKMLVSYGADPNALDSTGQPAIPSSELEDLYNNVNFFSK